MTTKIYTNINIPLFTAIRQWVIDNDGTPYVTFKICPKCCVPAVWLKETNITINLSDEAHEHLTVDSKGISFRARFNGAEFHLYFPIENIVNILDAKTKQFSVSFPIFNISPEILEELAKINEAAIVEQPKKEIATVTVKRKNHLTLVK